VTRELDSGGIKIRETALGISGVNGDGQQIKHLAEPPLARVNFPGCGTMCPVHGASSLKLTAKVIATVNEKTTTEQAEKSRPFGFFLRGMNASGNQSFEEFIARG
jgi:hypothetical protein